MGEYFELDTSLCGAIHMLAVGHHQLLIVTKACENEVILRLTDVFKNVSQTMESQKFKSENVSIHCFLVDKWLMIWGILRLISS